MIAKAEAVDGGIANLMEELNLGPRLRLIVKFKLPLSVGMFFVDVVRQQLE